MRFPTWPWVAALISCTPETPADGDDSGDDDDIMLPSSMEGTSTRTVLQDGVESCSESYALTGTPYEGDCPDCVFAFEIQATPLQSSGDCPPDARLTWAEDPIHQNIRMALAEQYEGVSQALLWGTSSPTMTYYGGTLPAAEWLLVAHEGATDLGEVSWDGETLEANTEIRGGEYIYNPDFFRECGPFGYPVLAEPGPTLDSPGTVQCDTSTFDAWEFEAAQGSVVQVWVDNVPDTAPEATLGPMLGLTNAETCLLAVGSPTLPCASSPPGEPLLCPGLLVVGQGYPCDQGAGGYVLRGNLDGTPLAFSQSLDDAPVGTGSEYEERASLVAHIAP
jgi:hypothetical protein